MRVLEDIDDITDDESAPTRIAIVTVTNLKSEICEAQCEITVINKKNSHSATMDAFTELLSNAKSTTAHNSAAINITILARRCSSILHRAFCDGGKRVSVRATAPDITLCSHVCNDIDNKLTVNVVYEYCQHVRLELTATMVTSKARLKMLAANAKKLMTLA